MTKRTTPSRLLTLLGLLLAVGAAVPTGARFLEPSHDTPVPQLAAFGFWALPVWLLAGGLLLVGRSLRPAAAIVVVLAVVLGFGVRWQLPPIAARDTAVAGTGAGLPVRVLSVNVLFGQADADQAAALVRRHRVDVLVVQELTEPFRQRLRAAGIDRLLGFSDLHPRPGAAGTGIWSRWPLQAGPGLDGAGFAMPAVTLTLPAAATTGAGGGRTLAVTGIHTQAPTPGADTLEGWRADLALIARTETARDKTTGPQLYVGDFNASRDHSGFRDILATGLVDAADAVPAAGWPGFTWPADRPGPAFTRIDHILLTPASVGVHQVDVLPLAGTDHRAVLAELVISP